MKRRTFISLMSVMAAAGALSLAGCSGSDSGTAAASASSASVPADQLSAALVAYALHLSGVVFDVVGSAALFADSSAADPVFDILIGNIYFDDLVDADAHYLRNAANAANGDDISTGFSSAFCALGLRNFG